jgi:hypothetical protein
MALTFAVIVKLSSGCKDLIASEGIKKKDHIWSGTKKQTVNFT